jgi:dinuclear metal center YbgI/SA1388 family protein
MILDEIVVWLDTELRTAEIQDCAGAMNGLQLANSGKVTKVAAAVDASLLVVKKAIAAGADLLIVHHGMFWQGAQPLCGAFYEKIKLAMDADLAIYSSHLPLDIHPQWGNNILLADAIGLQETRPFLKQKNGQYIGLCGDIEIAIDELADRVSQVVNGSVHICSGGSKRIKRIGLCTGGAGNEIAAAAAEGVDTFITGEGSHWSYSLAEELRVNLFYAGHYATEIFGVRVLAKQLTLKFHVQNQFIDHPTGL